MGFFAFLIFTNNLLAKELAILAQELMEALACEG
jgi:hypothetical protein